MQGMIGTFATTAVVHHGPGALGRLADEITKLGGRRPGLITDAGVVAAGLAARVVEAVDGALPVCDEAKPEPCYELVDRCVAFLRDHGCDSVVALGGGSSIDTAKMAAVMMTNEGEVPDYFGAGKVQRPGLPVIAIPTTAGTGSEVSPASVFVDPRDKRKTGVRSDFILPKAAILDPELTVSLPQALTASTGIDALTHAIECYTSPRATLLSDMAAERAIELIGEHLPVAYALGSDTVAREGMLMGSYLAGLSLAIANVGIVHALAQTIGGIYGVRHGIANSLFLPYVMAFNRIGCREKYANVAALLGEPVDELSLDEASMRAVEAVRRLSRSVGIPQRLSDLDIPQDALGHIATRCLETQGRLVTNNPRVLSHAEAVEILENAY